MRMICAVVLASQFAVFPAWASTLIARSAPGRISLSEPVVKELASRKADCERLEGDKAPRRVTLYLRGLRARVAPDGVFEIRVGLGGAADRVADETRYLADLPFYDIREEPGRNLSLELTPLLRAAVAAGQRACPIVVYIKPKGAVSMGTGVTIDAIEVWAH